MWGFIFGTACLTGLIHTLRGGGHFARHPGRWGWRGRMRWLFQRLDTSPGQEKVFVQTVDEVSEAFGKLQGELSATRAAVARALRGEQFDAASLRELNERQDALIADMREVLRTSVARIHEALDPRQRRELADLIEHGGGMASHPYRGRHGWRGGHPRCA
ncbi:periplasmic heavy metal sensor [Stigmatella sp. ncwal1]|uniref:Periplasmic heavy metal sensor n=1 Tax=Stigmatella ashevillensis TaxID=2995309 RepID=A0ABT5D6T1_9BACT|nr:periplasmic heavy metal sensor [Stigmatella ashevillena]MDC0709375.1 periplasmic heavy metal sensor [Stigmatella ashevillena]